MDGNSEGRVGRARATATRRQVSISEFPSKWPTIIGTSHLRGCNVYHPRSVFRIEVEFGALAGRRTAFAGGAGFAERFAARFRPKREQLLRCDIDPEFLRNLGSRKGVVVEEALLQAIISVEAEVLAQMYQLEQIEFARVLPQAGSRALLVWETHCDGLSPRSAQVALRGFCELLKPFPASETARFEADLNDLRARAARRVIPGSTALVRIAARQRGVPLVASNGPDLYLGQGVFQRHMISSLVGSTSTAATFLARSKRKCNQRLAELYLPVPVQIGGLREVEEVKAAAERIGLPVVIKPSLGNQGRGVTVGIDSLERIGPAVEYAQESMSGNSSVVIEQHVQGRDYRLLVVGGRMVAALACLAPSITGDGLRTVQQLIEAVNTEPDRDDERVAPVRVTSDMVRHLASQGLTLEDVPAAGRQVELLAFGHLALGGLPVDVTNEVHPDNREAAERAAAGIGMDVAGIDFICPDISRSYRQVGGAILEVNARPALGMHVWPREGRSRDVAGAIVDFLFPPGSPCSVPKLLVGGDRGTGRVARAAEEMIRATGINVGLCLKRRAYLGGVPLEIQEKHMSQVPASLLREPSLECLVAAISLRRAATHGLGLETCDAAMILPRQHELDGPAFERGIEVLIEANRGKFVVLAKDGVARAALRDVDPSRIVLIAAGPADTDAQALAGAGNPIVTKIWLDDSPQMALFDKGRLVASALVPDRARSNAIELQAQMGALALAFSAGVSTNRGKTLARQWETRDQPAYGESETATET